MVKSLITEIEILCVSHKHLREQKQSMSLTLFTTHVI